MEPRKSLKNSNSSSSGSENLLELSESEGYNSSDTLDLEPFDSIYESPAIPLREEEKKEESKEESKARR